MIPRLVRVAIIVATALAVWASTRLSLSSDLTALFPNDREGVALTQFVRAFGGADLGVVLIEAPDSETADRATLATAAALEAAGVRTLQGAPELRPADPTAAWRFAGPSARARLRSILTPEGMRTRLRETKAMLMAPGAASLSDFIALDPLRLTQVPWEQSEELAAGVHSEANGSFSANGGKARLVIIADSGSAFGGKKAFDLVSSIELSLDPIRAQFPTAAVSFTGGQAIAVATEKMVRRDLIVSGILSTALSAILFIVLFRRARALIAVLPPLLLGTLWTTAIAAVAYPTLSAIAVAFTSVVVGVGVDTGVHVYGALLEARRRGLGVEEAKIEARHHTWKPTLTAAFVAGAAFASLLLSDVEAMRQLGALCGAGEILTAIAIVLITPEIGAWLERGDPPPALTWKMKWLDRLQWERFRLPLGITVGAFLILGAWVAPKAGDAIVALRPTAIAPIQTYDKIYALFGGSPGQWVVVSEGDNESEATHSSDTIAEWLEARGGVPFDALSHFLPSSETQRTRLAERDSLHLGSIPSLLRASLAAEGFDAEAFAEAYEAFSHPSTDVSPIAAPDDSPLQWMRRRHIAHSSRVLSIVFVRPPADRGARAKLLSDLHAFAPKAIITGYSRLEDSLRNALTHDLPRIGIVTLVVVAIALRRILKSGTQALLTLASLGFTLALVFIVMHLCGVRLHIYNALVLPVLLGITLDEVLFLLHAAREEESITNAVRREGPLVTTTAFTTAAGFGALLVSSFDGLRDLAMVGAVGSIAGLFSAFLIVPFGLRMRPRNKAE